MGGEVGGGVPEFVAAEDEGREGLRGGEGGALGLGEGLGVGVGREGVRFNGGAPGRGGVGGGVRAGWLRMLLGGGTRWEGWWFARVQFHW